MVKFRRSTKSDKSDSKPHHISIPPKDAIAIIPPKKVIKALYDYQPRDSDPNSGCLSFSTGDFLHVVGRENDADWYEACNPLQGSRGLVPVKYFETVGKTVRDSGGSTTSVENTQHNAGHDSGYAEKTPVLPSVGTMELDPKGLRMSRTMGKGGGAMVYGVVMYDFKAERPDELEAKEGEAIIVIAQSNPEWFVAKPITRLGGPGLIPVSFIEIRDMATGQAVPDAAEAVQRAGVPRVEEWKKMAADYKNGSIPLGKLESGPSQLQQGMERMSLGNRSQTEYDSGYASTTAGSHQRSNSAYRTQSSLGRRSQQPQLLAPVRASVPRYCFADEIFWFIVEAQMEDGRYWELSRLYQDFYDLQINLIQEYPLEAGNVKGVERSLPYMPGPVTYVTDNISNGRRQSLDEYIRNLLKLGPHITGSFLLRKFFAPKGNDYEIDPEVTDGYRLSAASQYSSSKQSFTDPSNGASRQSSHGNLHGGHGVGYPPPNAYGQPGAGHQRAQPSLTSIPHQQPPQHSMLRENSALTQTSTATSATSSTAALKIKVWFEEDSCVVIRMPASMRFADLYRKLQERRALEVGGEVGQDEVELSVEYRDEGDGAMYPIEGDEDLRVAVERNPKLTLRVGVVRVRTLLIPALEQYFPEPFTDTIVEAVRVLDPNLDGDQPGPGYHLEGYIEYRTILVNEAHEINAIRFDISAVVDSEYAWESWEHGESTGFTISYARRPMPKILRVQQSTPIDDAFQAIVDNLDAWTNPAPEHRFSNLGLLPIDARFVTILGFDPDWIECETLLCEVRKLKRGMHKAYTECVELQDLSENSTDEENIHLPKHCYIYLAPEIMWDTLKSYWDWVSYYVALNVINRMAKRRIARRRAADESQSGSLQEKSPEAVENEN